MTGYRMAPVGYSGDLAVAVGPRLLAGVTDGPELSAHRRLWPAIGPMSAEDLIGLTGQSRLLGRGGAGFPFHRKLTTAHASGRKRSVVVNAAEGEPGSAKDAALLVTVPHLVLDGAELVAAALGCPAVLVVVPSERPPVIEAVRTAIAERPEQPVRFEIVETAGSFVSGQSRAVIELVEGRPNLPVTSWSPEAVSGIKGRPTLLSNAETYAQVAAIATLGTDEYVRAGLPDEPGTALLTVAGDGPGGVVVEVPYGVEMHRVLEYCGYAMDGPVLVGGYHGTWLPAEEVAQRRISRADLALPGPPSGPASSSRSTRPPARSTSRPGSSSTSPGTAPAAADPARTVCRPSRRPSTSSPAAPTGRPPTGSGSLPGSSTVAAPAPTRTAPCGWSGRCSGPSPTRSPPTSTPAAASRPDW